MGTIPTLISAGNMAQNPVQIGGVLGQGRAFFMAASFQTASGGLPGVGRIIPSGSATPTGITAQVAYQGFGASLIGTGLYAITHPPAQHALHFPAISVPSGQFFQVTQQNRRGDSQSGLAFFQVGQSNSQTGIPVPQSLPTGSRFDLLTLVTPRNDQGIVRF